jgi:hypothetical protein
MGVIDFNGKIRCDPVVCSTIFGVEHARRTVGFFTGHQSLANAQLPQMCSTPSRRTVCEAIPEPRSVPGHGICPAYPSRESSGYRSLSSRSEQKAPPYGNPGQRYPGAHWQMPTNNETGESTPTLPITDQDCTPSPCAEEDLGLDLDNTVHALDASTIDLCLFVFPWALFRSTKSAVKLHTLLDLRGNIPTFIHISDGKLHDVNVLDILIPEPRAFYIMDRGYVDFERLFALNQAGAFFVIRTKRNTQYKRRYSHTVDKSNGLRCNQTIVLTGSAPRMTTLSRYDESNNTTARQAKRSTF